MLLKKLKSYIPFDKIFFLPFQTQQPKPSPKKKPAKKKKKVGKKKAKVTPK